MRDPKHRATLADLEGLPPNVVGQLIEGVLVTVPRPSIGHAVVTANLGNDLGTPFGRGRGGPGGWWFLDEPELHFGDNVLVPDLAAWRRERMPTWGGDDDAIRVPPFDAIELELKSLWAPVDPG